MALPKTVVGTGYRDIIYANRSGYDYRVIAGDGNDYVVSSPGNDTIQGDGGNDTLIDRGGEDLIYGGEGNDVIYAGAGDDTYFGGAGWDAVSFRYAERGIEANLATGQSGYGFWQWHGMGTDTLVDIEALYGSSYGDRLTGDAGRNNLFGYDGDDVLDGGAGDDWLSGGNGNDIINAGTGNDTYEGGYGNDTLYLYHVNHGVEIDLVAGTLVSRPGATGADDIGQNRIFEIENIFTGNGDDIVDARGAYAQNIYLSGGDDFVLAGGGDSYYGGQGTDTLNLSALNGVESFLSNGSAVDSDGDVVRFSGFERIIGSAMDDAFHAHNMGQGLVLHTAGGADRVTVRNTDMTVALGTGNDTLSVMDAHVTVAGGDGVDIISLGSGVSGVVSGDDGIDDISVARLASGRSLSLDGGNDFDRLTLASTRDDGLTVDFNAGSATWRGGSFGTVQFTRFEALVTGDGDDVVQGDGAANRIVAEGGNNTLSGNGGDDLLRAGAGADILSGGDGNDLIDGGGGSDLLTGGAGQDTFSFLAYSGSDRIADFDASARASGGDLLALHGKTLIDGTLIDQALDMDTNRNGRVDGNDLGFAQDGGTLVLNFGDGSTLRLDGVEQLYYDSLIF